jgi:hypothetical protein
MSAVTPQDYHPFREDMFFKVILLRSGEKILCALEKDTNPQIDRHTLKIIEPVVIDSFSGVGESGRIETGSRLRPWMNLSDSDEYIIPYEFVIAVGDMRPDVKKHYVEYVNDLVVTKTMYRIHVEQVTLNKTEEAKMNASIMDLLGSVSSHPVRFTED